MNRFRALPVFLLALVAALTIAACGDSGGDEDPQEVLEATFSNDEEISSGVLDVSFDLTAEGGEDPGTAEVSLGGPFESGSGNDVPKFDITAEIDLQSDAQDFSGSVGVVSTGDSGFVNIQGTDYEVPAELFTEFTAIFEQLQTRASSLAGNPANWLTDLSNEGNEDVEGTDTIHISGEADVPELIDELKGLLESLERVTPDQLGQLDQLTDTVKSASLDVFTGADDDILRKLEGSIELDPPDTPGASEALSLDFSVTIAELNEPQEIAAPTGAQPLGDLLQQFNIDPSQLGAATDGGSGASAGGNDPASQAYLDCLAEAQGAEALDQCAALIGQ